MAIDGPQGHRSDNLATRLRRDLPYLLGDLPVVPLLLPAPPVAGLRVSDSIMQRTAAIHAQLTATLQAYADPIDDATHMLLRWMVQGKIVRVLGSGGARLAASIPGNRLAHGGARVHV